MNMNPTDSQINTAILALLRAGIVIRITPQQTPFGILSAQITFEPPNQPDPDTAINQFHNYAAGAILTLPFATTLDLFYDPNGFAEILAEALKVYVRGRPTFQ